MKAHFYCISSARQIFKIQKLRIGEDKNERRVQVIPQQYSAILPFGKKPFRKKDFPKRYYLAKQFGKKIFGNWVIQVGAGKQVKFDMGHIIWLMRTVRNERVSEMDHFRLYESYLLVTIRPVFLIFDRFSIKNFFSVIFLKFGLTPLQLFKIWKE